MTTLTTTRYVRRGVYLGQIFRPGAGGTRDFPRHPGIIARGSPLKLFRDEPIRRAYKENETLSFNTTTYRAALLHEAIPDKTRARLFFPTGVAIDQDRWEFVELTTPGTFDGLQIDPQVFDSTQTYILDYQTNDSNFLDDVPVDELRNVLFVGDLETQRRYVEGRDYIFTTTLAGPTADVGNTATDPAESAVLADPNNSGTMTVAVGGASNYAHNYNRQYVVEVVSTGPTVVSITAIARSSGDNIPDRSVALQNEFSITLPADSTDEAVELGLTLDFTTVAGAATGDRFFLHGYGPGLIELVDANQNTNEYSEVDAFTAAGTNTGTGTLAVNPQSDYSGTANQHYEFEVTAAAGVSPTRTATLRWRRAGNLPQNTGVVNLAEATPSTLTRVLIEDAIYVDFDFGATNYVVSDSFTTTARVARALYTGKEDRNYTFNVTAVDENNENATVSYFSDTPSGGFDTVVLEDGEEVDLGSNIRVVMRNHRVDWTLVTSGASASMAAAASSQIVVSGLAGMTSAAVGRYLSLGHPAAGLDVATATNQGFFKILAFNSATEVVISATSIDGVTAPGADANNGSIGWAEYDHTAAEYRYGVGDSYSLTETFDGQFDWRPNRRATETIDQTLILQDATGGVTGTVGAYFIRLTNVPVSIDFVKNTTTNANLVFNTVADTNVVYFSTNPAANLEVRYEYAGIEPTPGSVYYITGYIERPQSDYDRPVLLTSRQAAEDFFAPTTTDNDAAIGNQVIWDQDEQSLPGVVAILVQDPDGDGVYEVSDYRRAIAVSELNSLPTDKVVLNKFEVRNDLKNSTINMNDPFVARECIAYYGFPVGTPIGDEFTPDTRVFVTKQELQVTQNTPARGTLAVIANSYCRKTVRLADDSSVQLQLDGSYLAAALAGRVASFDDPASTVLGVPVAGFDEIEELNERELEVVQAAGMIGVLVEGNAAEYDESITTDPDSGEPSVAELSGTVQRQYTVRRVRARARQKLIGIVPPSAEAGVLAVQGFLVEELAAMVAEGIHAPYTDDNGNTRPIDPSTDVEVIRSDNATDYHIKFWWNQRYPIKRVFGLYSVDRKLFGGAQS